MHVPITFLNILSSHRRVAVGHTKLVCPCCHPLTDRLYIRHWRDDHHIADPYRSSVWERQLPSAYNMPQQTRYPVARNADVYTSCFRYLFVNILSLIQCCNRACKRVTHNALFRGSQAYSVSDSIYKILDFWNFQWKIVLCESCWHPEIRL